jgi:antitoxin VapB
MHGRSQAVRLPKEFRFEGTEVRVRRDGQAVVLEPVKPPKRDWKAFWADIDRLVQGKFGRRPRSAADAARP